ncbi:hypothetical protein HOC01_05025 [archaeon]|jgi:hypothetical protein|nr:hypothetical protein [archaeon]MBT6698330.1 hypothetical protein [archaeon]
MRLYHAVTIALVSLGASSYVINGEGRFGAGESLVEGFSLYSGAAEYGSCGFEGLNARGPAADFIDSGSLDFLCGLSDVGYAFAPIGESVYDLTSR